jgi:type III pantothenate kinase
MVAVMIEASRVNHFLALAVGNTRTRLARFRGAELVDPVSLPNTDQPAIIDRCSPRDADNAVIASVNHPVADAIEAHLARRGVNVLRIGRDLPIPIAHALDDASTTGQDRLLCALAAWSRAKQACVIVDAGTAITIDFVDGEGTFRGGVIAPGLAMMLAALHQQTSALPKLEVHIPDAARGPFGLDTRHAMQLGVVNAARGLVRHTVETYAERYGGYPQIVATGGDAPRLFENDDLIEHIVPDLQLLGIQHTLRAAGEAMSADDEEETA